MRDEGIGIGDPDRLAIDMRGERIRHQRGDSGRIVAGNRGPECADPLLVPGMVAERRIDGGFDRGVDSGRLSRRGACHPCSMPGSGASIAVYPRSSQTAATGPGASLSSPHDHRTGIAMTTFSFVTRHVFAWCVFYLVVLIVWSNFGLPEFPIVLLWMITLAFVIPDVISHIHRVRMIVGEKPTAEQLRNRQRRQIEVPFPADEAFALVDAALRELPRVVDVESARDSLRVRAGINRPDPYGAHGRFDPVHWVDRKLGGPRDIVVATVLPGGDTSSITLACEPETAAWTDWLRVDHGANLETIEAITRAITRRVAEHRRGEKEVVRDTASAKELSEARLSLLNAQVEPHFLYNTLASAQALTRSDPERADAMLGHLIAYLRRSLPRNLEGQSTLGEELERAVAYLEILKIRMGARLSTQVDVPETLHAVPFPSMMQQTLVENA
ncbi:MAG: histidine kinase, partial [Luteimonas sp.]|nr:histidine kinase [Luteimonas sp.]